MQIALARQIEVAPVESSSPSQKDLLEAIEASLDIITFIQRANHKTRSDTGDHIVGKLDSCLRLLDNIEVRHLLIELYFMATNSRNADSHYCQQLQKKMDGYDFIAHSSKRPNAVRRSSQPLSTLNA